MNKDSADRPPRAVMAPGKVTLAVTASLLAFLLATSWSQESAERRSTAGRREQLATLVAARQRRVADLQSRLADARRRLAVASRSSRRGTLAALEQQLELLVGPAGTGGAHGSGIVVRLADSPLAQKGDAQSADFAIQDVDLQLVVNALWAAGAEAIAINGQRIIGTTAIRSAGGAVLVNYAVLTSPYRIAAIGDPGKLVHDFSTSPIAKRFRSWADVYQLGFRITKQRRLDVPAYSGAVSLRFARPASPNG